MIDPAVILRTVADLFGVSIADLIGTRRYKRLTSARQAAAYALRQAGLGVIETGELLRRDHSTITYSVRQAERRTTADPAYAAKLHQLLVRPSDPPPALHATRTRPAQRVAVALTPQLRLSLSFWGVATPIVA